MPVAAGEGVAVSIRPESVRLEKDESAAPDTPAGETVLRGRVDQASFQGQSRRYDVQIAGWRLMVLADPQVRLSPGDEVRVSLSLRDTIALADGNE